MSNIPPLNVNQPYGMPEPIPPLKLDYPRVENLMDSYLGIGPESPMGVVLLPIYIALILFSILRVGYNRLQKAREEKPLSTLIEELVDTAIQNTENSVAVENGIAQFQERLNKILAKKGVVFTGKYFKKKLTQILLAPEIDKENLEKIVSTVTTDFANLCLDARKRAMQDVKAGMLVDLGISTNDTLQSIQPLGDESHNHGKVPLLLTFKTSEGIHQIVYKPRSMLPEKLICDTKEGILRHFGFGTYHIINCEDKDGKYGYSEFLENKAKENIFESIEQMQEYQRKVCILEKIVSLFGFADLHYSNIICKNKEPYLIDGESFLMPHSMTGLFEGSSAGAYPRMKAKNQFWLSESCLEEIQHKALQLGLEIDLSTDLVNNPITTLQMLTLDYPDVQEDFRSDLNHLGIAWPKKISDLNSENLSKIKENMTLLIEEIRGLESCLEKKLPHGSYAKLLQNIKKCHVSDLKLDNLNLPAFQEALKLLRSRLMCLNENIFRIRDIEIEVAKKRPEKEIDQIKKKLSRETPRYVLIGTQEISYIPKGGVLPEKNQLYFTSQVEDGLKNHNFTKTQELQKLVLQGLNEDVIHNDTPIFYYDVFTNTTSYNGNPIGILNI